MPKRSAPSLLWLTLAVVLPLLILAAVAWWGTRSQLKAAWAEARTEAARIAPALATDLEHDLKASINTIPTYPHPPVPGTASPKDEILDGTDLDALEALRNDQEAGVSPAGLPRRALAALLIHRLDPSRQGNDLESILTIEAPSILTSRAMDSILTGDIVRSRWQEEEMVRALQSEDDTWIRNGDEFFYIVKENNSLGYAKVPDIPLNFDGDLPSWTQARLTLASDPGTPHALASTPVRLGNGLLLLLQPVVDHIERPVRRQQRWIFTILAASFVTAAGALAALNFTLRHERKLNEMKSQFVASVSHELRAPVASIRLMADALEAEKVDQETAKKFHRLIAREGSRLSTLVSNVLDHSRIEQGRRTWKKEPCDLCELTADTLRVMEPLATEKNLSLASELSPTEASVDADAIQQALINLLDNAIKFSPPGSTITTRLSSDDSHGSWSISVQDCGPGVPKHEQGMIFERFYRPGDELRRETQGTGIGLSLVKAITEAHDGTAYVVSREGKGSTFTITGKV